MRTKLSGFILATSFLMGINGCDDDDDVDVIRVVLTGTSAADFITLSDYLDNPVVQGIFTSMPRNQGSSPPNLDGTYFSTGTVVASTFGLAVGEAVEDEFCFGPPAGSALEVAILDPAVVDAGAFSFIEGSGNLFTVYTAFKTVQTGPDGFTCEIHQVVIFSGRKEVDNSLGNLFIGFGIVGLVGDCGNLLVDDIQISQNSAARTGDSCVGGGTPINPNQVLVIVDNFLVADLDVFVDDVLVGVAPLLSSLTFEAAPGFTLSFESVPPLNESSEEMGEILAGTFSPDTQPRGRLSQYAIGNQIGDDFFFAPILSNQTAGIVTASVNVGTNYEFTCGCVLPASALSQYFIGYHAYDVVEQVRGAITPDMTNVVIDTEFPPADPIEFLFEGPFTLGLDSGALSLIVP